MPIKKTLFGHCLSYTCPKCGDALRSPLPDAGTKQSCPQCGAVHVVPGKREAEEFLRAQEQAAEQKAAERQRQKAERAARKAGTKDVGRQRRNQQRDSEKMIVLVFPCPHCGKRLNGKPEWAGRTAKCPACLRSVVVPQPKQDSPAREPSIQEQAPATSKQPKEQTAKAKAKKKRKPPKKGDTYLVRFRSGENVGETVGSTSTKQYILVEGEQWGHVRARRKASNWVQYEVVRDDVVLMFCDTLKDVRGWVKPRLEKYGPESPHIARMLANRKKDPLKPESYWTKIAGLSFPNKNGTSRQAVAAKCSVDEALRLIREPHNPYGANAVAVYRATSEQLGYVPRELAGTFALLLDRGDRLDVKITRLDEYENEYNVDIEITPHPPE